MPPFVKLALILALIAAGVVLYGRIVGRRDNERSRSGLTDTVRSDVSREIAAGHKINAIKVYRDATGVALTEAKSAIDTWFVPGIGLGLRDAAAAYTEGRLTGEARSRISQLVTGGRREDAMRLYAEATGASNSEAQAIIRTWDTTQDF